MRGYRLNWPALALVIGGLAVAAAIGALRGHLVLSLICAAGLVALILVGEATSSVGRAEQQTFERFHGRR